MSVYCIDPYQEGLEISVLYDPIPRRAGSQCTVCITPYQEGLEVSVLYNPSQEKPLPRKAGSQCTVLPPTKKGWKSVYCMTPYQEGLDVSVLYDPLPRRAGRKTLHSPTIASLKSEDLCFTVNLTVSTPYTSSESVKVVHLR